MWKNIRILCLLIILLIVAVQAWRDQNQDWNQPIVVVLPNKYGWFTNHASLYSSATKR